MSLESIGLFVTGYMTALAIIALRDSIISFIVNYSTDNDRRYCIDDYACKER